MMAMKSILNCSLYLIGGGLKILILAFRIFKTKCVKMNSCNSLVLIFSIIKIVIQGYPTLLVYRALVCKPAKLYPTRC